MKKRMLVMLAAALLLVPVCAMGEGQTPAYVQITQDEAKRMMEEMESVVILDVREQDEYDAGHIPGAVLLPVGTIDEESAASVLADKDTVTLVYCRSGRRSKIAAEALAALGYTQVYEFGGVITWPYALVTTP